MSSMTRSITRKFKKLGKDTSARLGSIGSSNSSSDSSDREFKHGADCEMSSPSSPASSSGSSNKTITYAFDSPSSDASSFTITDGDSSSRRSIRSSQAASFMDNATKRLSTGSSVYDPGYGAGCFAVNLEELLAEQDLPEWNDPEVQQLKQKGLHKYTAQDYTSLL
ncbi:hypothetical protein BCR37DRAFT_387451 [Protomyces lactucae-debilis]|uniref:Uncharacterized protein n=1 Tax=Protomyces lactucae-debilis TaxID=2754530 RepID=A0A1Y2FDH6_PROLT|nr:uncharacterized protein BCR37DRAFT_387451 [Protomyces lactucae-debilis]ORY81959.1 hypothetical protein BCR37DRAFT_387451 [Protomyces lactucae-debilis]